MVNSECWYEKSRKEYVKGDGTKTVLTDERYLDQHAPVMREQLKKAGFRLGRILNEIFG